MNPALDPRLWSQKAKDMFESETASSSTSSITPQEFDQWTRDERTDTKLMDQTEAREYNIHCICSEVGEVADVRKRWLRRDHKSFNDYREDILLELGDVLHYVCRIADDHGFTLEEVMAANVEKITNRKKYGKGGKGKRS